ncbi:MAG: LamG-like jellyroll fold domain-containing protein, partial [Verrucomicrobiales bacterium]
DYVVEFFSFEGGGGSNQEILINSGLHNNLNANHWQLFGDMGEYNPASRWGVIPASVLPYLAQEGTDEAGWHAKIWYQATNGLNQQVNNLDQTMRFIRDIDAETSTYSGLFDGFLDSLNHSATGGNAGRINPTQAYPDPTDGGSKSGDRIAMVAHARLVVPADGDYTVQVRADDGCLMRFMDPANTFHTENGNAKIEMLYPSEISKSGGTTNTRAAAYLTAGAHDIVFVWWEGGGGDHFEVSVVDGVEMNQNAAFVLLDTSFTGKGPSLDNDADGLSDPWEIANFGDITTTDGTGDADSDGLTDAQEFAAKTDPNNEDSDGDGLNDGVEANTGTDPTNSDTDGDGLQDGAEIATHNTDPTVADSDGDGFNDGDEITSGTNPNNPNSFPALDVPLAYWPFDDQNPVTTEDVSGGNNGTLNGGPVYVAGHTDSAGDYAIQFDGINDFVGSGAQLLNLKDGFTMSGWVNFTASQANRTGLFGQNDLVEFGMISATTMQLWTPRAGAVNITFGPSSDGWRHIAVTGDAQNQQVYIDGQLSGTGAGPAPLANSGFTFNIGGGGVYDGANNWFNGQIDDVAVWDVVLGAEIIANLADGTLTPLGANDETPLEITGVEFNQASNEITLTWRSRPNTFYAVDQSPDLANWDFEIDDSVQSTGETTSFTFPLLNTPNMAFFRVRVSE